MAELWHRQPVDTDESWPEFVRFRDEYPRRTLLRARPCGLEKLRNWYAEHSWKDRVAAYDAHMDAIRLEERAEALRRNVKASDEEVLTVLEDWFEIWRLETEKVLAAVRGSDMPMTDKISVLVKMGDSLMKGLRLFRGQSTENVAVTYDFSKLSDDEKRKFRELLIKVQPSG